MLLISLFSVHEMKNLSDIICKDYDAVTDLSKLLLFKKSQQSNISHNIYSDACISEWKEL